MFMDCIDYALQSTSQHRTVSTITSSELYSILAITITVELEPNGQITLDQGEELVPLTGKEQSKSFCCPLHFTPPHLHPVQTE